MMKWFSILIVAAMVVLLVLLGPREAGEQAEVARPSAAAGEGNRPAPGDSRPVLSEPTSKRRTSPGPEPQEPRPVTFRVLCSESASRSAKQVPNITFQVFRQRPDPAAVGPRRRVPRVHRGDQPLLENRTDEEGVALVELDESQFERDQDGRALLVARVVEPGYQQRFGVMSQVPEDSEQETLRLIAYPGATARGRVIDESSRGVQAEVHLRKWRLQRGIRKLSGFGKARQLTDGWFELDLREDVADGVLIADAANKGTGSLKVPALTLKAPPQDLEIVVSGSGRLRGRVLDTARNPAAGLELLALLAEFDDERGSFIVPEPLSSQRRAEGGGRLWVTLQTGPAGEFDVQGLRAAPYVLRARTGQKRPSGYPQLLTQPPVLADGEPLELRLTRPHLVVRVLAADGGRWKGPGVKVRQRRHWYFRITQWPTEPTIMVFPCTPPGGEEVVQDATLAGRVSATNEAVYELPEGARYLVGVMGGGFLGELQVVDFPLDGGRVECELRAPGERALGSVSVRVFHNGAELDGRSFRETGFNVSLERVDTSVILLQRKAYGVSSPFELTAPAGRYRIVAEGIPIVDTHHGVLLNGRELGRTELEVEIAAGGTRDVDLELVSGGRVSVSLSGSANPQDLEAVAQTHSYLARPGLEEDLRASARCAQLFLIQPGRRPEVVFTTVEWTESSAAGTHLETRWPLGERNLSQVLPTGRFTLRAVMPGGRTVETQVDLKSGETTRLELDF